MKWILALVVILASVHLHAQGDCLDDCRQPTPGFAPTDPDTQALNPPVDTGPYGPGFDEFGNALPDSQSQPMDSSDSCVANNAPLVCAANTDPFNLDQYQNPNQDPTGSNGMGTSPDPSSAGSVPFDTSMQCCSLEQSTGIVSDPFGVVNLSSGAIFDTSSLNAPAQTNMPDGTTVTVTSPTITVTFDTSMKCCSLGPSSTGDSPGSSIKSTLTPETSTPLTPQQMFSQGSPYCLGCGFVGLKIVIDKHK